MGNNRKWNVKERRQVFLVHKMAGNVDGNGPRNVDENGPGNMEKNGSENTEGNGNGKWKKSMLFFNFL